MTDDGFDALRSGAADQLRAALRQSCSGGTTLAEIYWDDVPIEIVTIALSRRPVVSDGWSAVGNALNLRVSGEGAEEVRRSGVKEGVRQLDADRIENLVDQWLQTVRRWKALGRFSGLDRSALRRCG